MCWIFSVTNLILSVTSSYVSPSIGLNGFFFLIFPLLTEAHIAMVVRAKDFKGSYSFAALSKIDSTVNRPSACLYRPVIGSFRMTGKLILSQSLPIKFLRIFQIGKFSLGLRQGNYVLEFISTSTLWPKNIGPPPLIGTICLRF
jgi:hypothetical protein